MIGPFAWSLIDYGRSLLLQLRGKAVGASVWAARFRLVKYYNINNLPEIGGLKRECPGHSLIYLVNLRISISIAVLTYF